NNKDIIYRTGDLGRWLPDAIFFGCEAEVEHIRTIAVDGTSADKQLQIAGDIPDDGLIAPDKLDRIVDHLVAETLSDL
ncbi:MAG: hypothetical protein AAFN16_18170, partial [Pseudomonadota bacterium]